MSELQAIHDNRIVYSVPGMEDAAEVETFTYKTVDGQGLSMDVYRPAQGGDAPLPAVVFVHGDGPEEDLMHAREWGQYVSYGQLMAACGLVGITFSHRSTQQMTRMDAVAEDIDDAVAFVRAHAAAWGLDAERLCLWAVSAGVPYGVCAAVRALPPYVRCVVAYYGFLSLTHLHDEVPDVDAAALARHSPVTYLREHGDRLPPLLIARAGADRAAINESIDQFVGEALQRGVSFDLLNHAEGGHGFDIFEDTPRTHAIIRQTLEFVGAHLTA